MTSIGSSFLIVDKPFRNKPRIKYVDNVEVEFNYKIVVIGPSESGKTEFIKKYIKFCTEDEEVYVK